MRCIMERKNADGIQFSAAKLDIYIDKSSLLLKIYIYGWMLNSLIKM